MSEDAHAEAVEAPPTTEPITAAIPHRVTVLRAGAVIELQPGIAEDLRRLVKMIDEIVAGLENPAFILGRRHEHLWDIIYAAHPELRDWYAVYNEEGNTVRLVRPRHPRENGATHTH